MPDDPDSSATIWAFLWVLFAFKMATVVLIFWHNATFDAGMILGATTWYWFPALGVLGAAPVAFYLRKRKVRARRAELLRSEWMVGSEDGVAGREQARR